VEAHIEDGQEVRVVEGGDGPCLTLEARESLRIGAHIRGQDL
jgi:hypothetical protein